MHTNQRTKFKVTMLATALLLVACGEGLPVDPHSELCLSGFDAEHEAEVISAIDEWSVRTDGGIAPTIGCSLDAIPISGVEDLHDREGEKVPGITYDQDAFILLDVNAIHFHQAALHELGHLFAGPEHSDDPRDIMHWEWTEQMSEGLTDSDVARFVH